MKALDVGWITRHLFYLAVRYFSTLTTVELDRSRVPAGTEAGEAV
jgi:hypothetical protein